MVAELSRLGRWNVYEVTNLLPPSPMAGLIFSQTAQSLQQSLISRLRGKIGSTLGYSLGLSKLSWAGLFRDESLYQEAMMYLRHSTLQIL